MHRHLFQTLIKNPDHTSYEGKDNDEEILYVIRRSIWVLAPNTLFVICLAIAPAFLFPYLSSLNTELNLSVSPFFLIGLNLFWYLFTLGIAFQTFIIWYFNVFIITNKKIFDLDVRGLLYKNISEAALRNIEDVTSRVQGTLGTVFNIGSIFVQTAAQEREFEFTMMDHPAQMRDFISDIVSDLKQKDLNN